MTEGEQAPRRPRTEVKLVGGPWDGHTATVGDPRDLGPLVWFVVVDGTAHALTPETVLSDVVDREHWKLWEPYARRDDEPRTYDHAPEEKPPFGVT